MKDLWDKGSRDVEVHILGGGVVGLSTALALQMSGFRTCLTTSLFPYDVESTHDATRVRQPEIASDFAAASVIPHSINMDHLNERMRISQKIFTLLNTYENMTGVGMRRHYELFEEGPKPDPSYRDVVNDYKRLPDDGSGGPGVPKRDGAEKIWGWGFKALFASTNIYLRWLYDMNRLGGGILKQQKLSPEDLTNREKVPGKIIINCTGYGSTKLFPELYDEQNGLPYQIVRGHLVHLPFSCASIPKNEESLLVSYNYWPDKSANAEMTDVYYYPRKDDIVLGGTRQAGKLDESGQWQGQELQGRGIQIGDECVPLATMAVNRELIYQLTKGAVDIDTLTPSATKGYRFVTERVLLERGADLPDGRPVIHSVGYGGGGVTMSWGAANAVVDLVGRTIGDKGECRSLDALLRERLERGY